MTGVKVIIGNCLPVYLAMLWRYGRLKFFQEQRSVATTNDAVGRQY